MAEKFVIPNMPRFDSVNVPPYNQSIQNEAFLPATNYK